MVRTSVTIQKMRFLISERKVYLTEQTQKSPSTSKFKTQKVVSLNIFFKNLVI